MATANWKRRVTSATWKLGDAAGVNSFIVQDSAGTSLLDIDSNGSTIHKLGDASGVESFQIQDSLGATMFKVDSDGNVTVNGGWTNITTTDLLVTDQMIVSRAGTLTATTTKAAGTVTQRWQASVGNGTGDVVNSGHGGVLSDLGEISTGYTTVSGTSTTTNIKTALTTTTLNSGGISGASFVNSWIRISAANVSKPVHDDVRLITAHDFTSGNLTVATLTGAPLTGDTYEIFSDNYVGCIWNETANKFYIAGISTQNEALDNDATLLPLAAADYSVGRRGSLTKPALSYVGATTTGVYYPHTSGTVNGFAVAVAGTQRGNFSASGLDVTGVITTSGAITATDSAVTGNTLVAAALGNETLPVFTFAGDLNTGFYSSAADTIKVATGGSNAASFTSAGITTPGLITATGNVSGDDLVATNSVVAGTTITATGISTGATFVSSANGSTSAPAYRFTSGSTTGLVLEGGTNVQIVSNGTVRGNFHTSGANITGTLAVSGALTVGSFAPASISLSSGLTLTTGTTSSTVKHLTASAATTATVNAVTFVTTANAQTSAYSLFDMSAYESGFVTIDLHIHSKSAALPDSASQATTALRDAVSDFGIYKISFPFYRVTDATGAYHEIADDSFNVANTATFNLETIRQNNTITEITVADGASSATATLTGIRLSFKKSTTAVYFATAYVTVVGYTA